MNDPLIYVVSGEPSGDMLGAQLMTALSRLTGGRVRFAGVGGEAMTAAGLDSLFPARQLAVMGLVEVLPRVRQLKRRLQETVSAALDLTPDVVVTIDSQGFSTRVARRLRAAGLRAPLVQYVAPQVWGWRPERAAETAALFDQLLVLFPFEVDWFAPHGLRTVYVGHPAVERFAHGDPAGFRADLGVNDSAPLLGVLPGSRRMVVRRLLPVFRRTLLRLTDAPSDLRIVAPTVETVADTVAQGLADLPWPVHVVPAARRYDALPACTAALACSGTITLELALADVPFLTAYRANPLTAWMVRRVLTSRYATMANVLLDRMAVPEFLQGECRPERLAPALAPLLRGGEAVARQREAFATLRGMLADTPCPPSEAAARAVLAACGRENSAAPAHAEA